MAQLIKNINLLSKYYLNNSPKDGPIKETELNIQTINFDLGNYYKSLLTYSSYFTIKEELKAEYLNKSYPIYSFSKLSTKKSRKILIFTTIHGNESATALVIPKLLDDIRSDSRLYENIDIKVVGPMNPVGLAYCSRYNGTGYDINRDFKAFKTKEARLQRDLILELKPDFVISLHEGPQEGFLFITTKLVNQEVKSKLISSLAENSIELANKNIIKLPTSAKGIMNEGFLITTVKKLFNINTLGSFTNSCGIPLITTESPWSEKDINNRITPHLILIRNLVKFLSR